MVLIQNLLGPIYLEVLLTGGKGLGVKDEIKTQSQFQGRLSIWGLGKGVVGQVDKVLVLRNFSQRNKLNL